MAGGCPRPRPRRLPCRLLLAAAAAAVAAAAAAATTTTGAARSAGSGGLPSWCPRPATAQPTERGPLLDAAAVDRFLAQNFTVPGGEAIGFPPGLTLGCGDPLPRTGHVIECAPGWPVGGIVLRPRTKRPPTASVVFVHGLVGAPHQYLLALAALLHADAAWWSTVRVAFPVAPAYGAFLKPLPDEPFYPGTAYGWYDPSGTDAVLSADDLRSLPTRAALAKALASGVSEDVAGLSASARRLASVACREAAAIRGGGRYVRRGGRGTPPPRPPVVLLGHVRGGTAALGAAALAPPRGAPHWAGVVSLFGGAPLVPFVGAHGARVLTTPPRAAATAVMAVGGGGGGAAAAVRAADAALATAFWRAVYGPTAARRVALGGRIGEREVLLVPSAQARVVAALREVLEGGGATA